MGYTFMDFIQKMKCAPFQNQGAIFAEAASTVQYASRSDLQALLGMLNASKDTEFISKVFAILAFRLTFGNNDNTIITSCIGLYDQIAKVVGRGLPMKTTLSLNLVSAILLAASEAGGATLARNMLRDRGCLAAMCNLFTTPMMYEGTWRALCQSLAEVCTDSEENQSCCSHLVPLCIRRCHQGNKFGFSLLLSLVCNHKKNMNIFFESNGGALFTREYLQYIPCMQLASVVVQHSAPAAALCSPRLVPNLRHLLRMHGPYSQIGQWCTINLYHIDAQLKNRNRPSLSNSKLNFLPNTGNEIIDEYSEMIQEVNADDTTHLFQNVMKEILNWKAHNPNFEDPLDHNSSPIRMNMFQGHMSRMPQQFQNRITPRPLPYNTQSSQNMRRSNHFESAIQTFSIKRTENDSLSFSFLMEGRTGRHESNKSFIDSNAINITLKDLEIKEDTLQRYNMSIRSHKNVLDIGDLGDFKPTFMSTPKTKNQNEGSRNTSFRNRSRKQRYISKANKNADVSSSSALEVKHRSSSMSTRFFDAINDSCTTFVKTIKSIFKPKLMAKERKKSSTNTTNNSSKERDHCKFSFTKHMLRRKLAMRETFSNSNLQSTMEDFSENNINSCHTCNDTTILKNKLDNDKYLKQTVKKLKLGINLYGCDFKKISKVLWPRDSYMTPHVLYNLYRKLLMK